jgi:Carboxypeptidase regulatory-like domain
MHAYISTCAIKHRSLNLLVLGIAILLLSPQGISQTAGTGSIQGTISDVSGAIIANAEITITNTATQIKHSASTGESGLYSFPNLAIGTYTVEVVANGFKHYRQSNVVLEVGSSIAINVVMMVGATDQQVEVQANSLALQTEDSSFKQTIDQKTLTDLPLNGRQVTSLITLSGGSVNANENNDQQGSKTFYSSVVVSIAGGQGNATDYRLDGGDHNDYMTNINLPFPFPDAVAQFSVETTALGAQSGLHPGGLVNVVTRSGSNQWHGSGFEFIRNNFINATNFFSSSKDTLHQNQYGGTFGGKVIRDKLFFFAGYQRTKAASSQASTRAFVPTAGNLMGDFSVTDGPSCQTNAIQLLNPQTGAVLANNHINPSTFSAGALALQKYLPATTDPCGLVSYSIPSQTAENEFITRVDSTLSPKNTLYGRYFLDGYQSLAFYSPTNILVTNQAGNYERVQGLTLGETYVITSNIVNSFHASATRRRDDRGPAQTGGISPATIGLNMYTAVPVGLSLSLSNKWGAYNCTCAAAHFNVNTFSFADDINWVHGKHQIGFGAEFARAQLNISNIFNSNGSFTFSGIYSQKGPNGTSAGGTGADANLDFLTGSMSNFVQSKAQQNALRASIPSVYIQDTYHVTKNLVLSAGVRWDPEYFPTDYFGRGSTFNMSAFLNNTVSTVYPNAPAGSFYYGDSGVPKAFTKNTPWQFSPRVGATLDPFGTGKTVFRVGAALVYDEPNLFTGQETNFNPPFAQTISNTPVGHPLNFDSPWSNGTTPNNPFPLPFKPTASTQFQNGGQYIVLSPQFRPPYTLQWTASMQQEFGHGWQFQIDYIGNKTSFNPYGYPFNPAVYIPGTCGSGPCSTIGNTASRYALTLANPAQGPKYAGGGGGSGSFVTNSGENASYNGMITTIQHRLSSSFVFLANYTWSHCIDIADNRGDVSNVTMQNPANLKGERASCGFDYRAVFNTAVVASSHFSLTGWKAQVVNNWEIAPLVHITDGAPFTVVSGVDNSLTAVNNDRPNVVNPNGVYTGRKILSGKPTNAQYINLSAFATNPAGTFGNSGRNAYRGPKFLQVDTALSRTFPLHERLALNLRMEAFNVLNHPNFAAPGSSGYAGSSTSLVSSTFGQVTSTVNGYGARIFQGAVKLTF